jgi:Icc-related predicted phosphoesterase
MERDLHILHLTDIHGAHFLIEEIGHEIRDADLVILSGDITHFGRRKEASIIIEKIRRYNRNILAVSGNCDYPVVEEYLGKEKISLHRKIVKYAGYTVMGLGGSLPCPGTTPFEYTEDDVKRWLAEMKKSINQHAPILFVSHQPPVNTLNDDVGNGRHVGSSAVRNFIEAKEVLLCVTGHIHEGIGIDTIDNCKVVNPGPFRTGKYAKIAMIGNKKPGIEISLEQITVR